MVGQAFIQGKGVALSKLGRTLLLPGLTRSRKMRRASDRLRLTARQNASSPPSTLPVGQAILQIFLNEDFDCFALNYQQVVDAVDFVLLQAIQGLEETEDVGPLGGSGQVKRGIAQPVLAELRLVQQALTSCQELLTSCQFAYRPAS